MQAATIQIAEHRDWYRLVGHSADLFYWKSPEARLAPLPEVYGRPYAPGELEEQEQWIAPLFEPVRLAYLVKPEPLPLYMPEEPYPGNADVAVVLGVHPKNFGVLKEFVVHRVHRTVHAFDIVSHGRRFYRSLVYTTDTRYTQFEMQASLGVVSFPSQ